MSVALIARICFEFWGGKGRKMRNRKKGPVEVASLSSFNHVGPNKRSAVPAIPTLYDILEPELRSACSGL